MNKLNTSLGTLTTRTSRATTLGAMFAATLALAACGGGGSGGEGGAASPPPPVAGSPAAPTPTAPTPTAPTPTPEPVLETPPVPAPAPLPTPAPATPAPPPSQQLPAGVDVSSPGVVVTPVTATSSPTANQANSALKAIDGNATTRWESTGDNAAWIQFDFGAKTQLGYLKLVWENAYGKEYALQGSDDGQAWSQLRYVVGGKGGTEEFFNLNAHVRYIRLQGVARATPYGYSLFEVQFKSPGTDNSLLPMSTAAVPFPANGSALAAPAPAQAPLETVQLWAE
jgi:hypothetical protein